MQESASCLHTGFRLQSAERNERERERRERKKRADTVTVCDCDLLFADNSRQDLFKIGVDMYLHAARMHPM